jgi:hypothetical protein
MSKDRIPFMDKYSYLPILNKLNKFSNYLILKFKFFKSNSCELSFILF